MLALEVKKKRQTAAKSVLDFKYHTNHIFFPFGLMIGAVNNLILTSQSWEIGSHLTDSAGKMKLFLSCACIDQLYTFNSFI